MKIIQWLVISILFIFWLAEDEVVHIAESVQEGEFDMEEAIVAQGLLDEQGEAVYQVYADGDIALANSLSEIALSRDQAYALLDVLYRQRDRLRGREDTVPLQDLPAWAQPEEQEAEQWQATGTCQVEPTHTGRDVFRCDGCKRLACNECGETIEERWLCESCLAQEKATYPF